MSNETIKTSIDKTVIRTGDAPTVIRDDKTHTRVLHHQEVTKVVDREEKTIIREGICGIPVSAIITPQKKILVQYIAAEAIQQYRVVTTNTSGELIYADPTNPEHEYRILGITPQYIAAGHLGGVICSGELDDLTWNWSVTDPIYVGGQGILVQIPPIEGFLSIIAFPLSSTSLYVRGGYQPRIVTVYYTLTVTDVLNKYIDLQYSPHSPFEKNVSMHVIHGVEQRYGADYAMISDGIDYRRLIWDPDDPVVQIGLTHVISEGDVLQITYTY